MFLFSDLSDGTSSLHFISEILTFRSTIHPSSKHFQDLRLFNPATKVSTSSQLPPQAPLPIASRYDTSRLSPIHRPLIRRFTHTPTSFSSIHNNNNKKKPSLPSRNNTQCRPHKLSKQRSSTFMHNKHIRCALRCQQLCQAIKSTGLCLSPNLSPGD